MFATCAGGSNQRKMSGALKFEPGRQKVLTCLNTTCLDLMLALDLDAALEGSAAIAASASEEPSDEVFNLQCQLNFMTEQLAEARGINAADVHAELSSLRQQVASRDNDIAAYDERIGALETENEELVRQLDEARKVEARSREMAELEQASAAEARARARAAAEAAAAAQADAASEAQGWEAERATLQCERLCTQLLHGTLADVETELARLHGVHAEYVSSSTKSQQSISAALELGVQERAASERSLAEEQRERARLEGMVGVLEADLADTRAQLSAAKKQALEGSEQSVSDSIKTGQLESLLISREASLAEAQASLTAVTTSAEAAREQAQQQGAAAAKLSREVDELQVRLRAALDESAASTSALTARTEKAEAAAAAAVARMEALQESTALLTQQQESTVAAATAARREAEQAATAAEQELASTRGALASVQLQCRTQTQEAEQAKVRYVDAAKARRDAEVLALQRRLDEGAVREEEQRAKLAELQAELKRGTRYERLYRELEVKHKQTEEQLAKKAQACERILKRRSGAFAPDPQASSCPSTPAAPPPPPPHAPASAAPSPSRSKAGSPAALATASTVAMPLPAPPSARVPLGNRQGAYLTRLQVANDKENGQSNVSNCRPTASKELFKDAALSSRPASPAPGSAAAARSNPQSAAKKGTKVVASRYASPASVARPTPAR